MNKGGDMIMEIMTEGKLCIRKEVRITELAIYTYKLILNTKLRYSSFGLALYSVEISMESVINGSTSEAKSGELFADEKKALLFFDKLVRNLATPIDLAYIIEDEFT